jgi:hypothetical protein
MAEAQPTIYTAWEFSDHEIPQAFIFSTLNYQHIQTELAIVATEKALLGIDPANPLKSQIEAEYLRGKMEALGALLATSDNTRDQLAKQLQEELEIQKEIASLSTNR